jgi:hypothetical protein
MSANLRLVWSDSKPVEIQRPAAYGLDYSPDTFEGRFNLLLLHLHNRRGLKATLTPRNRRKDDPPKGAA